MNQPQNNDTNTDELSRSTGRPIRLRHMANVFGSFGEKAADLGKQTLKAGKAAADMALTGVLEPQDGKIHVLMYQSFSRIRDQHMAPDSKYNLEINQLLASIQAQGRQIVDIKFAVLRDQGMTGSREGYRTMIIYK